MKAFIFSWAATAIVFMGLDAIWLTQVSPRLYPPLIGELLSNKVELAPALLFYALFITGLVILAVMPAIERGGLQRAIFHAAVFGLVAYATYDLTNQATMRVWSTLITVADLSWGAFASVAAATAGYFAATAANR